MSFLKNSLFYRNVEFFISVRALSSKRNLLKFLQIWINDGLFELILSDLTSNFYYLTNKCYFSFLLGLKMGLKMGLILINADVHSNKNNKRQQTCPKNTKIMPVCIATKLSRVTATFCHAFCIHWFCRIFKCITTITFRTTFFL